MKAGGNCVCLRSTKGYTLLSGKRQVRVPIELHIVARAGEERALPSDIDLTSTTGADVNMPNIAGHILV